MLILLHVDANSTEMQERLVTQIVINLENK